MWGVLRREYLHARNQTAEERKSTLPTATRWGATMPPYTLVMFTRSKIELPFWNLSIFLRAWVCMEAVQTKNRGLVLGSSLSEFMRQVVDLKRQRVGYDLSR